MAFDDDSREERLQQEAEELMRQRRFSDAAFRYQDIRKTQPGDLWASLAYCSALECAGEVQQAEQILEETALSHRRSAPLHRFRRLFFERREDLPRALVSTAALEHESLEEGPEDQLADLYFNQGRYHEALGELERLGKEVADGPRELRASMLARSGACLRQTGELESARDRLHEALALETDNHWTLSELAETERALGDISSARGHYLKALAADPNDHWCRGHLAQLETEDGNLDRAIALYREIITAQPKTTWALVELAQVLTERDPAEARKLCEAAIAADPRYPWAHAHIGQLERRAGNLEAALAHFEEARSAAPAAPWVLHEVAECCRQLGRYEDARRHLERARETDPYDATTYGYFADTLRAEGKTAQAMAHLEKAVEIDPEYTWAWRELAEMRALGGNHAAAETAYRKAVEIDGDPAVNDGLRAFLLRCAGKRDAAQPWLERAVEKQHDYLWAWRELIDLHLAHGHATTAEATARTALEHIPGSAPLAGLLAESLRRQGRGSEAMPFIEQALADDDSVPQLHALRAEVLAEQGDAEAALAPVRRAIELDDSPEYRALYAQVLIAGDHAAEAEPVVRKLLAEKSPIQPAFELAAVLAERRGELTAALNHCVDGLAVHAEDPRLVTRRAKLGLQLDREDTLPALIALVEKGGFLPWRDAAAILAQANEPPLARRCAYQLLAQCDSEGAGSERRARAWLVVAETELTLGNGDDATQAATLCLALDPDCVPARILASVVADRRGRPDAAIAHLEHLDRRLHSPDGDGADADSDLLLRQLANLYERVGRHSESRACWERLAAHADDAAAHAELQAFRVRQDDPGAPVAAAAFLTEADPALAEVQRLWREVALHRARQGDPAAALHLLGGAGDHAAATRVLRAQLALAIGDHEACLALAKVASGDELADHALALIAVRAHLRGQHGQAAIVAAQTCVQRRPDDEEAATLLAEAQALAGYPHDALLTLRSSRLPVQLGSERGLLLAILVLECEGEAAFLATLGRLTPPNGEQPLVRVLACAWPGAWANASSVPTTEDVLALPPFPTATVRIATALAAHGRSDLAAHLALAVARAIGKLQPEAARRVNLAAVPWLKACGRRGDAVVLAWRLGAYARALRALWF